MLVTEHRSLRSIFLAQSARHSGKVALRVGKSELSYSQVEENARRWGSALVRRLGRPARRVGVLARRSHVGYVGALASLCGGAAFVPLNARFPKDRTRLMIEMADLCAIIVDAGSEGYLRELLPELSRIPVILAPDTGQSFPGAEPLDVASGDPTDALPPLLGDDLAYILFTSGTTGRPKGVAVAHENATHLVDLMTDRYRLTTEDRCSQTFDLTFDPSVFDMFVTWASGATLVAMREVDLLAPVKFVTDNRLTSWFSVPSIPAMVMKAGRLSPASMPTLRWSLFAGEALPIRVADAWLAAAPDSVVENLYGPTELTVVCLGHRWSSDRPSALNANGVVPIGRPFAGLGVALRGADGQLTDGPEGELCVCGPQTVPGYWRNPAQTAERFRMLEVGPDRAKRFYCTGDLVRVMPDGEVAFIGRIDDQVKVNGYRVELAEIEAVLMEDPAVSGAIAVPFPVEEGSAKGMMAFVIGDGVDPQAVVDRARGMLAPYAAPSVVHVVHEFPLNSNGKVDRAALAATAAGLHRA